MSRIRFFLLSVVAVLAVGGVASASASAETCGVGEQGGDIALCIQTEEIGSPSEHPAVSFTSKIKPATPANVATLTVTGGPVIICKKADDKGLIDVKNGGIKNSNNPEVSDLYITFTECEVNNAPTKCEVKEPIVASGGPNGSETLDDGIDGEFLNTSDPTKGMSFFPSQETEVEPGVFKKLFVKITIKAKTGQSCLFAKTAEVTGSQEVELPEVESEKIEHEVVAKATGSHLLYAGATATFSLQEVVALAGPNLGLKYSFQKS
jgi:hypothetical protein